VNLINTENAFLSAFLYFKETDNQANIWSKTVCRSLQSQDFTKASYRLGQLLEPSTLFEVAYVTKTPIESLSNLDYSLEGPIKDIKDKIMNISYLSPVEVLNVAYSLAAISRFELSSKILHNIDIKHLINEELIHYYYLSFFLKNRLTEEESCEEEFSSMKNILENQTFSEPVSLKVATQAIVWHIKEKTISSDLYKWYIKIGLDAVKVLGEGKTFSEKMALSAFHRAYAMVPAEEMLVEETRNEMEKALYYAKAAVPSNDLEVCRKLNAIKTCYESELKERLYLSKEYEQAERAGSDLIDTDPNWSISYHEMADVYMHTEQFEKALSMFNKAQEIGLPRITYTHFMMGYCLNSLGRKQEALISFLKTLEVDSTNLSAGINGYNISKEIKHDSFDKFKMYLDQWEKEGILGKEEKVYIK
jgi:tetratricopeptide (TPR) repeat protein